MSGDNDVPAMLPHGAVAAAAAAAAVMCEMSSYIVRQRKLYYHFKGRESF